VEEKLITRLASTGIGLGVLLFAAPISAAPESPFDTSLPAIGYERPRLDAAIYPKGTPKITSGFGATRDITGKQRPRPNDGIDIAVPEGTRVYATIGGRVSKVEETDNGYRISIRRKMPVYLRGTVVFKRFVYTYSNLSSINVFDGGRVRAGQKIAEVGASPVPHLHVTLTIDKRYGAQPFKGAIRTGRTYAIDPLYFLIGRKTNMILCRDKSRSTKFYRRVFKTAKHGYRLAHGMPLSLYPIACN
jgi:murein DD-endopeptidase MepM/ murein hydrolase activator NlpD